MKIDRDAILEGLLPKIRKAVGRACSRDYVLAPRYDDLCQDCALAAWRALEEYDPSRGSPWTFVYRRVHGEIKDAKRRDATTIGAGGAVGDARKGTVNPAFLGCARVGTSSERDDEEYDPVYIDISIQIIDDHDEILRFSERSREAAMALAVYGYGIPQEVVARWVNLTPSRVSQLVSAYKRRQRDKRK